MLRSREIDTAGSLRIETFESRHVVQVNLADRSLGVARCLPLDHFTFKLAHNP
jgi:hypothetical protein